MVSYNNKRIAQNTLLLYFRMLLMMAVSLYTSRIVLEALDIEDFGIYNVVGGVVAMFGFINSAMSAGTQRYLTFEIGKGDFIQLKKVFNTSVLIHAFISILIIILTETIGLWFFYEKMIIPADRMDAAFWVYQFSILSAVAMIMSVPYNAIIIAHERMNAFAYISVLEVVLKLLIVFLLQIGGDKLKLYALLIFMVQLIVRFIYVFYCKRHFSETKFHLLWDASLFREMLVFAGWNLWGNCAAIAFTQGLNLLLNMFFGPVVNAARAIAVQVQSAVSQFSLNFQTALNPQITKSYAAQDYAYMHNLIFKSSKYTFFLLLFLTLPVMLETETMLTIWLSEVPEYTVSFLRLMLCVTIIDAMANSLMVAAAATGKIKRYQSILGALLLLILPISYFVLKLGGDPISVFVVHLLICATAFGVRLLIVRPMIRLSLTDYLKRVLLKCIEVVLVAAILPFILKYFLPESMSSFFLICTASVISVLLSVYSVGLNFNERCFVDKKILLFISKIYR